MTRFVVTGEVSGNVYVVGCFETMELAKNSINIGAKRYHTYRIIDISEGRTHSPSYHNLICKVAE